MDNLLYLIERVETFVKFVAKCPDGKRGRPMSPARASELAKQDPNSICAKQTKSGGTIYYSVGTPIKKATQDRAVRLENIESQSSKSDSVKEIEKYRTQLVEAQKNIENLTRELAFLKKQLTEGRESGRIEITPLGDKRGKFLDKEKESLNENSVNHLVERLENVKTDRELKIMEDWLTKIGGGDLKNLARRMGVLPVSSKNEERLRQLMLTRVRTIQKERVV